MDVNEGWGSQTQDNVGNWANVIAQGQTREVMRELTAIQRAQLNFQREVAGLAPLKSNAELLAIQAQTEPWVMRLLALRQKTLDQAERRSLTRLAALGDKAAAKRLRQDRWWKPIKSPVKVEGRMHKDGEHVVVLTTTPGGVPFGESVLFPDPGAEDDVLNYWAAKWRDRKSTRLNSSHPSKSRMPSSA